MRISNWRTWGNQLRLLPVCKPACQGDRFMNELASDLKTLAGNLGADFFGIADLTSARETIIAQGGEEYGVYPRGVSFGIRLQKSIVDRLGKDCGEYTAALYWEHCYAVINRRLTEMSSRLAAVLSNAGYQALPVAASLKKPDNPLEGFYSNKMTAYLAGLGWIGKSCLLVTPEAGPRVRWGSVLTDAPLEPAGKPMDRRCGGCTECVDACPPRAFTGIPFDPEDPVEKRFDRAKCPEYTSTVPICSQCLYVCPWGRRKGSGGEKNIN